MEKGKSLIMTDNSDPWYCGYISEILTASQQRMAKIALKQQRSHPYQSQKEATRYFSVNFRIPSTWLDDPSIYFFQLDHKSSKTVKIFSTDKTFAKFCKLTLQAVSPRYLREIQSKFMSILQKSTKLPLKELIKIPEEHCTACYQPGHSRIQCRVCSYCLELGHIRQTCPINPDRELFVSTISSTTKVTKRTKGIRFRPYNSRPWFRRPNEFNAAYLDYLRPIGPSGNQLETLAIDIEGSGRGGTPGCVNVCGWVGNKNGQAHDLYFAVIRVRRTLRNPATGITGNQIEDLWNGTPIEIVRETIKSMLPGRRVVVHGGNDLDLLGITRLYLNQQKVTVVDTSTLFNEENESQSIALGKLVKFFEIKFWDRDHPRSLIQGHSSERDARATLKCYRKAMTLLNQYHQLPSRKEIDYFVLTGQNWVDWKKEIDKFEWKRNSVTGIPEIVVSSTTTRGAPSLEEQAFEQLFNFPQTPIDEQRSSTPVL